MADDDSIDGTSGTRDVSKIYARKRLTLTSHPNPNKVDMSKVIARRAQNKKYRKGGAGGGKKGGYGYTANPGDSPRRKSYLKDLGRIDGLGSLSDTMEEESTSVSGDWEDSLREYGLAHREEGWNREEELEDYGGSNVAEGWGSSVDEYGSSGMEAESDVGSAASLQLGRFKHMEPRIQGHLYGMLTNPANIEEAAAVEAFEGVIGGSGRDFARQLGEIPAAPSMSGQDRATALSMLNTAGEYLDKGPGSTLPGNFLTGDIRGKADERLTTAFGYLDELSDLYIHDATKESAIYGQRKAAVKTALARRLMDGVMYDGAKSIVAAPNELDIAGLRPTMSFRGHLGTSFDRVSFASEAQRRGWTEEDEAYWENMPNVKGSLFPLARGKGVDKAKAKRDQEHLFEQARYKFQFVRDVLREEMPTNRDESAGQIRMAGWDRPYGEQADRMSLINEALALGLDSGQEADLGVQSLILDQEFIEKHGAGTERGGKYGEKPLSEVEVFVQNAIDDAGPEIRAFTVGDKPGDAMVRAYDQESRRLGIEGIAQHTPQWYAARKGMITASKLIDEHGNRLTSNEMAANLASERLGFGKEFIGNAHTAEGIMGEAIAKQAFLGMMKSSGTPLVHTEVGLLQNPNLPGMGVSPDGRLATLDGENAGLLELKYLTPNSMEGAVGKYRPQMQMQMAVTGETQTHFFALDKYTGKSIHHIEKADEAYQSQLLSDISGALTHAHGLTAGEVHKLELQNAAQRRGKQEASSSNTGQSSSFKPYVAVDEPMTPFRARPATLGDKPGDEMVRAYDRHRKYEHDREEAFEMNRKFDADAADELSNSLKSTAKSVRGFGGTMLKVAGEMAAVVTTATDSVLDEDRAARMAGLDASQARGIRERYQDANLTTQQTAGLLSAAGKQVNQFATRPESVGSFLTDMAKARSNLTGGESFELPSANFLMGAAGDEYLAAGQDAINKVSGERNKMIVARAWGMDAAAAANDVTGEDILSARDESILDKLPGARATGRGLESAREWIQETLENGSQVGEGWGTAAGITKAAAEVAGTATVGAVGAGLTGAAIAGGRAALLKSAANNVPSAISKLSKTASVAAKATPVAIAAGLVPMATRAMTGQEDDGSLGDSSLDVLEMAAYGAAAGSFIPGVGTLVGAGVGAAAGLATEAWQYLAGDATPTGESELEKRAREYPMPKEYRTKNTYEVIHGEGPQAVPEGWDDSIFEEVVPSTQIEDMRQSRPSGDVKANNKIDLVVNVDPSMVTTEADVNGEEYELGTGYGT